MLAQIYLMQNNLYSRTMLFFLFIRKRIYICKNLVFLFFPE